jgi:hypothetical protein
MYRRDDKCPQSFRQKTESLNDLRDLSIGDNIKTHLREIG